MATFAGCKINKAATGYTLTATSSGLSTATSATFNVTVGPATQLVFTTQPSGATAANGVFPIQPVVKVQDAGGNTVTTSSASVTLAIGTNPGGGALTCTTNPVTASSGVATFAGCNLSKTGIGYTVTAASTGFTTVTSNPFNINAPSKVVFTTQPGGGARGVPWATQPVVKVEDSSGNVVTASSASVTLTIVTNPGSGTLTCTTNPLAASYGVATFSGCSINNAGTGYTVKAASGTLTTATSATFNIT